MKVALLAALVLFAAVSPPAAGDPWEGLRPLVGRWQGEGAGFGNTSSVTHDWDFVLADHFLRLRTRSVSAGKDGAEEVHEDIGFVSLDTARDSFVFRQFLSEGYVNTFDLIVRRSFAEYFWSWLEDAAAEFEMVVVSFSG